MEAVLEHELVGVPIGPCGQALGTLPVKRLVVRGERGDPAREVPDGRQLRLNLSRGALGWFRRSELTLRRQENRRPVLRAEVARIRAFPVTGTCRWRGNGRRPR